VILSAEFEPRNLCDFNWDGCAELGLLKRLVWARTVICGRGSIINERFDFVRRCVDDDCDDEIRRISSLIRTKT
jgi:hypothetical protein